MKSSERAELERMALMAEVAREFVHEFANFLNTMRLQFAVWEQSPDKPRDWSRIQAESQKLLGRLHDWHDFRIGQQVAQKIDLTRLLRQLAEDLDSQKSPLQLELGSLTEPEFLTTSPGDLRRFFLLLIECMVQCREVDSGNRSQIKLVLEPTETDIVVRLSPADASMNPLLQFAASLPREEESLVIAATRALAFRLEAEYHLDDQSGRRFLVLRLPREPT